MSGFIRAQVENNLSPRLESAAPVIRAGVSKSILRACLTMEGLVKRDIAAHGPVSRGDLRKSIHSRVEDQLGGGGQVVVGHVEANIVYARDAHEGQPPGRMPSVYRDILPWVKRSIRQGRLSLPTEPDGGRRRDKQGRFTSGRERQMESLAWAVAHGIQKHGTPGRPFFTLAVLAHEGRVVRQAREDVGLVMREAIAGGSR